MTDTTTDVLCLNAEAMLRRLYDDTGAPQMVMDHIRQVCAERDRLRDILNAIEIMTATGDGLNPDETMNIHLIAAEGRCDDPCAWRADPAVIERLRAAIKEAGQ